MAQYGVIVYQAAPADPMSLDAEYLEGIDRYPETAKQLGGKVLGGSYFPAQRGFAFESSSEAVSVNGETVASGPLVESGLVAAAFFVISAPDIETAVGVAKAHPALDRGGGVEVRRLYDPESR